MKYYCKLSNTDQSDEIEVPSRLSKPSSYRTPSQIPVQDQGSNPICVPCAIMEGLHFYGRLRNLRPKVSLMDIYESRENKDEDGMSAKEAYQFLKEKGEIKGFGRITVIDQALSSLFANGPLLLVLPVHSTDTNFWTGSDFLGYHAVACVGYDKWGLAVKNSWGLTYGNRGYATLSFKDANIIKEIWTITV